MSIATVVMPGDQAGTPEKDAFFRKRGKAMIALAVREILEEIARD